jgi:thymidine phosphorylase
MWMKLLVPDEFLTIANDSTDDEIVAFIDKIKTDYPADAHMAAALAQVLAVSGDFIPPKGDFSADVASTGGPSSLSTLLCPLFLLAGGAMVPKLGVPGRPAGGIDCLAQIEGYQVFLDSSGVEDVLARAGYAHFVSNSRLAPLDGRMFRLRQRYGAQDVPTLVAASLLSKKLAVGVRQAGLDIRVAAHGNYGKTWNEARLNAKLFIEAARLLSIEAYPVMTDARYPYQPFIGRSEALVALNDLFTSTASEWLEQHYKLCRDIALNCASGVGRKEILRASRSDLRKYFDRNLIAQGALPGAFDRLVETIKGRHLHQLRATTDGFVRFSLEGIRQVLVAWQKKDERPDLAFPDPVGLILLRRPGEWVNKGEMLGSVRIANGRDDEVLHDLEGFVCNTSPHPSGPGIEGVTTDG